MGFNLMGESADWFELANCAKADLVTEQEKDKLGKLDAFALNKERLDQIFFPERGQSLAPAMKICSTCPVKNECLLYALEKNQSLGVWGGTSERTRRRIRRARRLYAKGIKKEEMRNDV
jgi:hypothetical protein